MAIKKFSNLAEALAAGFTVDLGNGEYAEGGDTFQREHYSELFKELQSRFGNTKSFELPDSRAKERK